MNLSAGYVPYYIRNLRLAFPIILSQVGQVAVMLADNMMVGHVGTTELAASSFANNVFMVGMYFGMGITYGLTPVVGSSYGNGNLKQVATWLKNGVITHFCTAILLTGLMFGIYFLLPFMGQPEDVLEAAKPYYLLLCFSFFPMMLFFTGKQFFEGIGNTKIAMQIMLISNFVNILLNYLLIFGKFGFPALGLTGAGIGTLIARLIMPALYVYYIFRHVHYRRYFLLGKKQPVNRLRIAELFRIGIPIAFQLVVEFITFGAGAVMMGWLGEIPLAAHQVAMGLAGFTYMVSLGISQATTIRVSHQMGVKDFSALRRAAFASTHLVLIFMLLMGVVFIILRSQLPLLFTEDLQVIQIATGLLIVAAIFQVFDGLQVIMLATLRGMADVKIPMILAFVAYLGIAIPSSYLFAFVLNIGPQGIWLGYLVGLGAAGIFFYFRFKYNLKNFEKKKRVILEQVITR